MTILKKLQSVNPQIVINSVRSETFSRYGKLLP